MSRVWTRGCYDEQDSGDRQPALAVTRECHHCEHDRGGGNQRCLVGFDKPAYPANVSPQPGRRHERTHAHEGTNLGGNADLYVLVYPCDNDAVEYVSVGAHRLEVIDEVTCPPDAS